MQKGEDPYCKNNDDNEEGKFVADTIQEQKLRNHFYNRDFAILYRTNAQSRALKNRCVAWAFLILFMVV
jgi:Superfamily I DNA and RNA helicases